MAHNSINPLTVLAGNAPEVHHSMPIRGIVSQYRHIIRQFFPVSAKSSSLFTNVSSFSPDRPHSLPMRRPFRQIVLTFYQCVVLFAGSSSFSRKSSFYRFIDRTLPAILPFISSGSSAELAGFVVYRVSYPYKTEACISRNSINNY